MDAQVIIKKVKLIDALFQFGYAIKKNQLKKKYPHLSERELNHKTYALIEKGCK